ncbi:MAG: hypothetical protein ABIF77_12435, partial [bacterium]
MDRTLFSPVLLRRILGVDELLPSESYTLPRFLLGMVFQGVWWAGDLLVPFVLAKRMAASGGLITLAVTKDFGGMLLAVYWGYLLT